MVSATGVMVSFVAFAVCVALGLILRIASNQGRDPLKILSAHWGPTEHECKDITQTIRQLCKSDSIDIPVSIDVLGDPYPNRGKYLWVVYSTTKKIKLKERPEPLHLVLPPPEGGSVVAVRSAPAEPDNLAPQPAPDGERIILDLKPVDLTDLYKSHTSAQAQGLAAVYVGKWMQVSGPLDDAAVFGNFVQVTFQDAPRLYSVGFIYMYFQPRWFDRLSVLRRGSVIPVLGRVRDIGAAEVHLEDCELVDADLRV
jgi:hypothetical protein